MTTDVPDPPAAARRAAQARSFGAAARLYDATRPRYPRSAVEAALGRAPRRVADVGAGTGILTALLVGCGRDVVAVEPDAQMAAVLAERVPGVPVLVGRAEALPLADGAVDAVTCGQAFHWFDAPVALPELRRVLRPGGVLAATWNVRDHRVPWVARLSDVVGELNADLPHGWAFGPVGPWFADPEPQVVDHVLRTSVDGVLGLVRSRSFWITADDAERDRVERAVHALLADVAGPDGALDLPYRTCTFRMVAA